MKTFNDVNTSYVFKMQDLLREQDWSQLEILAGFMKQCRVNRRHVFLCGNGGSAANAIHIANDFVTMGVRATALPANISTVTSIGNDFSYTQIFTRQLMLEADPDDVLIVLSGSGNSPNILDAIETAKFRMMPTFGMLGFDGGKAKANVMYPIHFKVNDMQISEDMQLVAGHMVMQYLKENQ